MRKLYRMLLAGAACASIAACKDQLAVENQNAADQDRALARPTDVENLIAGAFNTMHRATIGATTLAPQMYVLGMENYSGLANQSMGVRASIPRPPINNDRGNNVASENYAPFLGLHRAARAAALGLNRVSQPTFTFFPFNASQTIRARAMAKFVIGVALGQLAMTYDSGSAVNENDDLTSLSPLPFVGYDSLAKYALFNLDSAASLALTTGTIGFPGTWFSASATAFTQAQFIGLVRGWAARIRAGVARDSVQRAAVDWTKVMADAGAFQAAFTVGTAQGDYIQLLTPSQGWDNTHMNQMFTSSSVNWHQLWGYMANFASSQTAFDAWLQITPALRQAYLIVTPDQRWPQGASRLAQQCQSGSVTGASCAGLPTAPGAFEYIENRLTDWTADPSAASMYRHRRFLALNTANRIGNFPSMTAAEMRLLIAEGQYRAGNFATAAALVDSTRVARGALPGLVANGVTNATTLVPGGATCVPRIPVGPTFTTTACGNLWEALKYEKRLETQFTNWAQWWFDGRGWGDLPAGTPPHWPVPYQEMDARQHSFYPSAGGNTAGHYGL